MKILIAPNAFKGSLRALDAAKALERGLRRSLPDAELDLCPIADGGEGTVDIFAATTNARFQSVNTQNAVGEPIEARYAILPDNRTAVLELAAASGLAALLPDRMAPAKASTFGTGLLIKDALDQGCSRIILGVGGSATTDGGTGILAALGAKLLNEQGYTLMPGGGSLTQLASIDLDGLDPRLKDTEIIVPCDVVNPMLGEKGSVPVYAPQKGAGNEQMKLLEEGLVRFAECVAEATGKEIGDIPRGGAAGGTPAGLHGVLGARLISGIDFMLHQVGFDNKIQRADFLITAEGRLDAQSLEGKGPYVVAKRASARNIPSFCVTGQLLPDFDPEHFSLFQAIFAIPTRPMSLEEAINEVNPLVEFAGWQIGRMLSLRA